MTIHCKKSIVAFHLVIISIFSFVYSDVRVEPGATYSTGYSGPVLMRAYNTTSMVYQLGGFRFFTPDHQWPGIDVTITANQQGNQIFHEARVKLSEKMELVPNGANVSQNYYFLWDIQNLANDGTISGQYVLLKTGSQGIPIDPVDENPITVDQIDSIIAEPDYYNADYRYLDSLGTYGGTYSGGLLDTYYGQTQIMLPIPTSDFSVNVTNINLDPSETGGPLYWMALAVGQEYFNIDKQLLIATGFKESGIAAAGLPYISQNAGGVYGAFHVENWTLLARAIAWPHFYPDDQAGLVASPNATSFATNYKPVDTFCGEYMGATITPENSGFIVNSVVISGLNYWYLYYLLGYAEDYCWKETLEFCIDPFIGVAALVPLYNQGMNSGGEAPLHVGNYQTLLNDPNARQQFSPGNSNYRQDIINGVEALVGASLQSLTDPNVQLWDDFITLNDIQTFFFGDGGTVSSQGDGGLLKQYDIDRQQLWSDVQAAFNKLSPHWGQSPAAISWRYDFLTLLRVVKGMFDVNRPRPADDESRMWIDARSQVGGCGVVQDDEYPFMDFGAATLTGNDFTLDVNVTDNVNVGEVKWTTDYDWEWWQPGTYISGTATDQDYQIVVQNATTGDDLWVWATDSSGNTIVKKTIIAGPKYPILDSTIIEDTRGNGVGDRITIFIRPASGDPDSVDDLSEYQNLEYSWPTQTNMITAIPANVTVGSDNLAISDNTLTGGAGLGKVTFDYPSKTGYEDDVLDKVAPAIEWDGATYYIPENVSDPDTLHITLTEPIENNLNNGTAYLNLKVAPNTVTPTVSTEVVRQSSTQWLFIFPSGTLGDKDSVNLIVGTGLVDAVGNGPIDINWFVPIKKVGNVEPRWVIGYIKDTRGDGAGDEITITIQPGSSDTAYQPDDCEEIRYSWPLQGNYVTTTIADPNVSINGNSFIIVDNTVTSGEGRGDAQLDFPQSILVEGDIIDSVGPAIVSAILKEKENAGDPDTLTVTFTEPVAENLVPDHQYLNVNGTPVTSLTAVKQDNQSLVWIFTFSANTVQEGDLVNLIHNSGLIDQAFYPDDDEHNPPLPDNQEVVVILLKGTYKVVDGSFYLDVDAEGTMDSIVITFNKNIKQEDLDLMIFKFVWLNSSGNPVAITVNGTDFSIDGPAKVGWEVSGYTLQQYVTSKGATWGQATLIQPDEKTGDMDTSSITVADGMAPVIVSAEYYNFNSSTISDTLIVVFSEDMGVISEDHPFKFKSSSNPEYLIEVAEVTTNGNQITFYVVNFTDNVTPSSGDSIWIYESHNVEDIVGIEQTNPDNIKQPLNLYYAYNIQSAAYLDTNVRPDGYIDIIRVTMSSVPDNFDFNSIVSSIVLPGYRSFNTLVAGDFNATATGFDICVTQSGVDVNTAVDDRDVLTVTQNTVISSDGVILAAEIPITDKLAPVITNAIFRPSIINEGNYEQDVQDTLEATFSERIKLPSTSSPAWPEPFKFCTNAGQSDDYTMELELQSTTEGKVMVFLVDTVLKDGDRYFPVTGDSIWIKSNAEIEDNTTLNNIQAKDTKPGLLIVRPYDHFFQILAFPNPFNPEETDQGIIQDMTAVWNKYSIADSKEGVLILVLPYGYVNTEIVTISAKTSIFDAVGNTIMEGEELKFNNDNVNQAWYFVWDARNELGRLVGKGTYLSAVYITEEQEGAKLNTEQYPVMIGIKK